MSEIAKKVLSQGTMPIMSDEGILKIFNYYFDRLKNKQALVTFGRDEWTRWVPLNDNLRV